MLTFFVIVVIVCAIFRLLQKIFVEERNPQWERNEVTELNFTLPREVVANHRPTMTLDEREKRRKKLINEIYRIGFFAREQLEEKHRQDRELQNLSYTYLLNKQKYVKSSDKPTEQAEG